MSAREIGFRRRFAAGSAPLSRRWTPRLRSTVMIVGGSLTATFPLLSDLPILPPLGFLAFVIWRLLAPDLLPPWCVIGFGAFDDLVSGNPLGTAILLWTVAALLLPWAERVFLFRTWRQDWMIGSAAAIVYLTALWLLSPMNGGSPVPPTTLLIPAVLSLLAVPTGIRLATGPGEPDPRRT